MLDRQILTSYRISNPTGVRRRRRRLNAGDDSPSSDASGPNLDGADALLDEGAPSGDGRDEEEEEEEEIETPAQQQRQQQRNQVGARTGARNGPGTDERNSSVGCCCCLVFAPCLLLLLFSRLLLLRLRLPLRMLSWLSSC